MNGPGASERALQLIGSLLAALLIVAITISLVSVRLPTIQERSPELHEAERERARAREREERDAERARERDEERRGDD